MQWFEWFVGLSAAGFWWCVYYRVTHRYQCNCEASFFWYASFRKHVNLKHGVA